MARTRKAFTLVELLIVIGIISILISLLLAVVNRSQEQARLAGCMSNQHQVGAALQSFRQNNHEACPGVCGVIPGGGPGATPYFGVGQLTSTSDALPQAILEKTSRSVLIIQGYLADSTVFHCPQQDAHRDMQFGITGSTAVYQYVFTDFFVGDQPCVPGGVMTAATTFLPVYSSRFPSFQSPMSPITPNRSQNPSRCVLITEDGMLQDWTQTYMQNTPQQYVHATPWHMMRAHKPTDRLPYIIADAAVCTYLDGHTEMVYVIPRDGVANYTVPCDQTGLPH